MNRSACSLTACSRTLVCCRGAVRWRVVLAGLGALALAGCGNDPPTAAAAATQAPSVEVAKAEQRSVTSSAALVGRVVAAERVELRARVPGFLQERKFVEGQVVAAGDELFRIEPDQYQAVVAQREADVAKARADAENAGAQFRRGQELIKTKAIAASQLDELRAAAAVAEAGVAQAEAALTAARLDLGYTRVTTPIAGRIGLAKYTVGNLVGPDSGVLATVVTQDPVTVQFPVTQRQFLAYRQRAAEQGGGSPVLVRVKLADGSLYEHPGRVNFVDVAVDRGTDAVTLRAEFPNPDGLLVDGQYAGLEVESERPEMAILVPQAALQIDQQGTYVLILDAESKAQARRIATGQVKGPDIVVREGLQAGDLVIVAGAQKARPGQPVQASPRRAPDQADAP